MAQAAGTLSGPAVEWKPPSLWAHPANLQNGSGLQTGTQPQAGTQNVAGIPAGQPGSPYLTGSNSGYNINQVQISPDILNSMQQYTDAAYQNQARTLDPQWNQARAAFDQKMIGQGLTPGSEAYNNAYQQFQMGQNDAYNQARNTAQQQGLFAQNQAFTQGYDNSQLANALAIAGMQEAGQIGSAGIGANASMYNNDANNATNQLLGLGNLGLGYNQQQMQGNQNDFQNMLSLLGYGTGLDQYNNQLVGGAQNTLLGLIPNSNPAMIDVNGAYGINQSGQNAQYQGQVADANSTNQTAAAVGSTALMAAIML